MKETFTQEAESIGGVLLITDTNSKGESHFESRRSSQITKVLPDDTHVGMRI